MKKSSCRSYILGIGNTKSSRKKKKRKTIELLTKHEEPGYPGYRGCCYPLLGFSCWMGRWKRVRRQSIVCILDSTDCSCVQLCVESLQCWQPGQVHPEDMSAGLAPALAEPRSGQLAPSPQLHVPGAMYIGLRALHKLPSHRSGWMDGWMEGSSRNYWCSQQRVRLQQFSRLRVGTHRVAWGGAAPSAAPRPSLLHSTNTRHQTHLGLSPQS